MSTLDDLKKMTGIDDVYQFSAPKPSVTDNSGQTAPTVPDTTVPAAAVPAGSAATVSTPELDEKIRNINNETLSHLKDKEASSQNNTPQDSETSQQKAETSQQEAGKAQGNTGQAQQDGGTLPEVSVTASRKGKPDYEKKTAAIAGQLENYQPKTKAPEMEDIPDVPKRKISMEEIYRQLNPEMSEAEQKKMQRRQQIDNLMSIISDGISAIASFRGTGKGTINTFNADRSMTAAQRRRMEEWQKKVAAYNKGLSDAQMKDADLADKDFKTRLQVIAARNDLKQKMAEFGLKLEDMTLDSQKAAMNAYAALQAKDISKSQFRDRMSELKRHNKVTEGLSAARTSIAEENAATSRARLAHQVEKDAGSDASNTITMYDPLTNQPVTFSKKKDGANYVQKAGEWLKSHGEKFEKDVKEFGVTNSKENPNPSESEIKNRAARYKKLPESKPVAKPAARPAQRSSQKPAAKGKNAASQKGKNESTRNKGVRITGINASNIVNWEKYK